MNSGRRTRPCVLCSKEPILQYLSVNNRTVCRMVCRKCGITTTSKADKFDAYVEWNKEQILLTKESNKLGLLHNLHNVVLRRHGNCKKDKKITFRNGTLRKRVLFRKAVLR